MRGRALIAAFLACGALATSASASGEPKEPLGHAGRWITDARGRVVVLHGFNTVPVTEQVLPEDMGMGPDNARWLAAHGFNTIRLGLYYARVEPEPGRYDRGYLKDYLRVQGELAKQGIFTLLDAHQDQLNPRFGTAPGALPSRGLPGWMIKDDGLENTQTPYPLGYLTNPALNRAYDNFWSDFAAPDGVSVQDHFAEGWRRIATAFRDRRGMLGYDFFNEPWPGSAWQSCAGPAGCPPGGFDQTKLTAFNRKLTRAIRVEDPEHLIFHEPSLQFNVGIPTRIGGVGDRNAGFSFHDYCLGVVVPTAPDAEPCEASERLVLENAEAQSERSGDALLLSEIPGYPVTPSQRLTRLSDEFMLSWQFWDYYGDAPGSLHLASLEHLIRPYPQLVAGTPKHWSYDPESGRFEFSYSTQRADGGRFDRHPLTRVEVPPFHYPRGYRARVRGARIVSAPDADPLLLRARKGAETVDVVVTPARHHPAASGTGRCLRRLAAIRLRRSVRHTTVFVNGRRVRRLRARRFQPPPGLTNGSQVRVESVARSEQERTLRGRVRGCHLVLRPAGR